MKKFVLLFAGTAIFAACSNDKKKEGSTTDTKSEKTAATLSLPVSYSSSFEMGNPDYAAMIVQGSWKDWQDNKLDNMKNWLADTAVVFQSNNSMIRGIDSLLARWKKSRATLTSVVDTIDAVMPVYSKDKKENWVLVWATEISKDDKGKTDTVSVMETWRINKDGKADLLLQYDRHARKQ